MVEIDDDEFEAWLDDFERAWRLVLAKRFNVDGVDAAMKVCRPWVRMVARDVWNDHIYRDRHGPKTAKTGPETLPGVLSTPTNIR
jgi:hypothetical protein